MSGEGILDKFFEPVQGEPEEAPPSKSAALAEMLMAALGGDDKPEAMGPSDDGSRRSVAPLSQELTPLLLQRGFAQTLGYMEDTAIALSREAMADGIIAGDRPTLFTWLHAQERGAIDGGFPRTVDGLLAYRKAKRHGPG